MEKMIITKLIFIAVFFHGTYNTKYGVPTKRVCSAGTNYRYHYIQTSLGYIRFHDVPLEWEDAFRTCRLQGAKLASPDSKLWATELSQQFTSEKLENVTFVHTGFHSKGTGGVHLSQRGIYLHRIDHTWGTNEPNRQRDLENVIAMDSGAKLYMVNMNTKYPFFCFKEFGDTETLNRCGVSDQGYYVYDGHCYKLHEFPQTWDDAAATCIGEGGYLAVIDSDAEATYLASWVATTSKRVKGDETYYDHSRWQYGYRWIHNSTQSYLIHIGFYYDWTTERALTVLDDDTYKYFEYNDITLRVDRNNYSTTSWYFINESPSRPRQFFCEMDNCEQKP